MRLVAYLVINIKTILFISYVQYTTKLSVCIAVIFSTLTEDIVGFSGGCTVQPTL